MINKLKRHLNGIKSGGFHYFIGVLKELWPHRFLGTGRVVLVAKESFNIETPAEGEYRARLATLDDLDILGDFGRVFDRKRCEYQLKRGDACVIIFKGDKPVMMGWGATGKLFCRSNAAILDTGNNGYYVYGGYTIREERKRGLANLGEMTLVRYYASQDRNIIYVLIDPKNTASITMHKNHGFETLGYSRFFWVFGILICTYKYWPETSVKMRIFLKRPPDGYDWV